MHRYPAMVDGTGYTAAQTFSWAPGSSHTIATTSLQSGGTGIQYVWKSWSDNGAISHTVAPTTNKTYTATFTTQYYLTMITGTGGTVSPASGWKNSGTPISISATPTNNTLVSYNFNGWSGTGTESYSGTNNPASITMNSPITETASFTQNPVQVTVQTSPTGQSFMFSAVGSLAVRFGIAFVTSWLAYTLIRVFHERLCVEMCAGLVCEQRNKRSKTIHNRLNSLVSHLRL